MNDFRTWIWPDVSTRNQIHFAILEGYWAAIVVAVVAGLFAALALVRSFEPETLLQFLIVVSFAGLAYGIERHSRAAAVTAFVLFVLDRLVTLFEFGPAGLFFSRVVTVALLNAMRGTFAYRKLPTPPPGTPTLEESFKAFRKVPIPPPD